jgi:hypothetical protein
MSDGKKTGSNKMEFSHRPDWYMILLTAVTVWILYSQYWAMRVDTRPWIQVKPSDQNPVPQVGKIMAMPLQFVNVGKTPAKRLLAYMFVEVVDINKPPRLPELEGKEIRSWTRVTSGIVFPNVSVDGLAKSVKQTPPGTTSEDLPISEVDYRRLMEGKAYLAVYAVAYYRDAFNTKHWTTFCGWHLFTVGGVPAACTAYNNVDDNLLW